MKPFPNLFRFLSRQNKRFERRYKPVALWLGKVLSWSAWTLVLLVLSLGGILLRHEDLVILILTIQTSLDAAATKTLQNIVQEADSKRDKQFQETLNHVATVIGEIKIQNDAMIRRDSLNTKAIVALTHTMQAVLDSLADSQTGGVTNGSRSRQNNRRSANGSKVARTNKPSRKTTSKAKSKVTSRKALDN